MFLNVQRSDFKGGGAGQFFAYQPSEELPHAGKSVLFKVLNYRKRKKKEQKILHKQVWGITYQSS